MTSMFGEFSTTAISDGEPPERLARSTAHRVLVKGGSGSGKTTFAAALARKMAVPHVELDALNHGPGWTDASPAELRTRVGAALGGLHGRVVDGNYDSKLGTMLLDRPDLIVLLDLPLLVKLRRLLRRTVPRIVHRQELWSGNVETWRGAFSGRESLFVWAVRSHIRHRHDWPTVYAGRPAVRLRSPADVARFLCG